MKYLIAVIICMVSLSCFAQPEPAARKNWTLTEVQKADKETVGYVYHTEALGTINANLERTSLRLICSTKKDATMSPIIAVVFRSNMNFPGASIFVKVDGKPVNLLNSWKIGENLLHGKIKDSKVLIDAMSKGQIITFDFDGDNKHWSTAFLITDFTNKLAEFETGCGLR